MCSAAVSHVFIHVIAVSLPILASTQEQEGKDEPCHDWNSAHFVALSCNTHPHTEREKENWHYKNNVVSLPSWYNRIQCVTILVRQPSSHKETLHPSAYWGKPLQESSPQAAGQSLLNEAAIWNSLNPTHQPRKHKKDSGVREKSHINKGRCAQLPLRLNPAYYNSYPCPLPAPILHHLFPHSPHRPKHETVSLVPVNICHAVANY